MTPSLSVSVSFSCEVFPAQPLLVSSPTSIQSFFLLHLFLSVSIILFPLFFLTKKVEQKSQGHSMRGFSLGVSFPLTNGRWQESFSSEVFSSEMLLRAFRKPWKRSVGPLLPPPTGE
jgi:hypothetical protein